MLNNFFIQIGFLSIWLVLLGLTIFSFIVSYIRAEIDADIIDRKWGSIVSLNHTTRAIITFAILLVGALLFTYNIKKLFFCVGYEWFLYSLFFDVTLNKMRNLSAWYIGRTSTTDKAIRKYLGENAGFKFAIIKLLLSATFSIGIL